MYKNLTVEQNNRLQRVLDKKFMCSFRFVADNSISCNNVVISRSITSGKVWVEIDDTEIDLIPTDLRMADAIFAYKIAEKALRAHRTNRGKTK